MSVLVSIRDRIRGFYGQFAGILSVCGRFLMAVFIFLIINREIGFNPVFSNMFVILIMALIASILNFRILALLAAVMILGNTWSLGLDAFGLTFFLFLLLLIMFVSFVPEDAAELAMMPLAIGFGVPALIPICCGLKRNPGTIAALMPGVIVYYYIVSLGESAAQLNAIDRKLFTDRLGIILNAMLTNRMIIMQIFAVAAVVIVVYAIRKLQADYAFEISVAAGGIMYLVMTFISMRTLEITMDAARLITGTVISVALAYIFLFFVHHVDYSKTERLTFEDDDYYYYVKAVPKVVADLDEEEDDYYDDEPDAPVVEQAALYAALQEAAKDVAFREEAQEEGVSGDTQNLT